MKTTILPLTLGLTAALAVSVNAAAVLWDGGGANTYLGTADNWDNDAVPATGNDYTVNDGSLVRIDDGVGAFTFAGDSLTITNGGTLRFDNDASVFDATFASLTIDGSSIDYRSNNSAKDINVRGTISLLGASTLDLRNVINFSPFIAFSSGSVSGSGSLDVVRDASGSGVSARFLSNFSGYAGDVTVRNAANTEVLPLDIGNVGGWGSGDMTLGDYAILNLNTTFSSAGSSIIMSGTSAAMTLGADATVGGLDIHGNTVAAGTYTAAELTALGFGGTFAGGSSLTVMTVPEPSSAALLGLGGLALILRRRK